MTVLENREGAFMLQNQVEDKSRGAIEKKMKGWRNCKHVIPAL